MKKKILIGSLLVLTLLLLMPSIPAIQQKSIEEGVRQDLQEKLETINLDDLKDIEGLDDIKHPLLYLIVYLSMFRVYRFVIIYLIASDMIEFDEHYNMSISHPILCILLMIRAWWLVGTTIIWQNFWFSLADKGGWNWQ